MLLDKYDLIFPVYMRTKHELSFFGHPQTIRKITTNT